MARLFMTATAVTFLFSYNTTFAQDGGAATPEAAQQSQGRQLETLTTTSRKRTEEAQSVPIAQSTFSETFIEEKLETDLADIGKYAPNVDLAGINFTGSGLSASIRGISFADLEKTFEPSVGVAVDGVFLGSNSGVLIDMFDIESIEILRGPQGTLFGRNTIGGVINIRRTKPTGEFGAKLGFRYGSFNRQDYKLVINAPIVQDKLAIKVAGFIKKDKQFTRSIFDSTTSDGVTFEGGSRRDGQDIQSFNTAVLFTPNEDLEILFTFDHYNNNSLYESPVDLTAPQAALGGAPTFCDLFGFPTGFGPAGCFSSSLTIAQNNGFKIDFAPPDIPFVSKIKSNFYSLEINWDVGDYTITAITGYKEQTELLDEENTGSPFAGLPVAPGVVLGASTGLARAIRDQDFEQFSQEIRIASNLSGPFNFVAGAYYYHSDYVLEPGAFAVFGGLAQRFVAEQDADAYAIFAEGTYDITDRLRFTGGIRMTWEEKVFYNDNLAVNNAPFVFPDSLTAEFPSLPGWPLTVSEKWSEPTWRAGLDYQVTDDALVYFSYSRGFRSGGFNGRCASFSACVTPYDPETVDNFEIGLKSDWFDNTLRFNVAAFYTNYKDKQEEVITPSPDGLATETTVQNAASVDLKGFEIELQALPTDWLNLYGSLGFLDADYKEYVIFDADIGDFIDVSDIATLRRAPKWSVNVGADFIFTVGNGGELTFNVNYAWSDEFSTSPFEDQFGPLNGLAPRNVITSYGRTDFAVSYRGGLGDGTADYRVSVFVKDAFHGSGRLGATLDAGPFYFGVPTPGRIWGFELDIEI
ncbi:MAG: TonB-dependent receptor [Alphaproteobacteria bacterium]